MSTNALSRINSLLETPDLPSLGPDVRAGREALSPLEKQLDAFFSEIKISPPVEALIHSLVLLWHDYLNESHSISQGIPSADGSFLHGIMHRRELDFGNAKYWFHRTREHPCFLSIAATAATFLQSEKEEELKANLVREGHWDAFAFVDACENSRSRRENVKTIACLQKLQAIEFKSLLEYFLLQQ
ncbi:MAG: hypothetical protein ABIV39_18050 [Verrucomicrobiota bacterium]